MSKRLLITIVASTAVFAYLLTIYLLKAPPRIAVEFDRSSPESAEQGDRIVITSRFNRIKSFSLSINQEHPENDFATNPRVVDEWGYPGDPVSLGINNRDPENDFATNPCLAMQPASNELYSIYGYWKKAVSNTVSLSPIQDRIVIDLKATCGILNNNDNLITIEGVITTEGILNLSQKQKISSQRTR